MADIEVLNALIGLILLATFALYGILCFFLIRKERQREKAFLHYLENPISTKALNELIELYGVEKEELLVQLFKAFRQNSEMIQQSIKERQDYEGYVETWAHEIKVPLSLLTMVLDNNGESLSKELYFKLDFIRNQTKNYVSQILFYHRIKSEKKDYLFQDISLIDCIEEVLEDYKPLLGEKGFQIVYDRVTTDVQVFTDFRALEFMVRQIIGNSIKYAGKSPVLHIHTTRDIREKKQGVLLQISDNGQGVKECDLPHLFEKGFSGDSGQLRKKSTGMGLYLAKQLADDIHIQLEVDSKWQEGFIVSLFISS